jgi:hypothetical protein
MIFSISMIWRMDDIFGRRKKGFENYSTQKKAERKTIDFQS